MIGLMSETERAAAQHEAHQRNINKYDEVQAERRRIQQEKTAIYLQTEANKFRLDPADGTPEEQLQNLEDWMETNGGNPVVNTKNGPINLQERIDVIRRLYPQTSEENPTEVQDKAKVESSGFSFSRLSGKIRSAIGW